MASATGHHGIESEAVGGEAAAPDARSQALIALVRDFLDGKDPVELVRARGARVDESFAATGNHPFRIAELADEGSSASVPKDPKAVSPDTLTLVVPAATWLRLEALKTVFGEPRRMPALPGRAWQYRIMIDDDRSLVIEMSGDPTRSSARVAKLKALRERP